MRKSISFHGIQIIWFTYVELSNVFCTWKLILLIKILRIEGETAKNPPNTSHIPLHIYNKVAMWGFRETKRATYSINLTFPDKNIISVTAYIYVWHKFTFLAWRKNNMKWKKALMKPHIVIFMKKYVHVNICDFKKSNRKFSSLKEKVR